MKPAPTLRMPSGSWPRRLAAAGLLLALGLAACGKSGPAGSAGTDGVNTDSGITTGTTLTAADNSPGVVLNIVSVTGGTGPSGTFKVGDKPAVKFTIKKTSGTSWHLSEMATGRIWLSGPTANYQRVYAQKTDLITKSVLNDDGSYTYTFATSIPSTYVAPLNGSNGVGTDNKGGQALVDGPYTMVIATRWNYTIDGTAKSDFANTTKGILIGATAVADTREVVKSANCNTCHVTIQAHGGNYRDVGVCVTCHTAGAMDKPISPALVGTVPIEFKVMIHKIHNGAHLPSVNGVSVDGSGNRDYSVATVPYQIRGYGNSVNDFSDVNFPVFPSFNSSMPRPTGYSALAAGSKTKETALLRGVVACYKCHGDPDGAGSLTAPSQGTQCNGNPSRRACGACHDDIKWDQPYIKNGMTMPPQLDDVSCNSCHKPTGSSLAQGIDLATVVGSGTTGTMPPTPFAHVHPNGDLGLTPDASSHGNNDLVLTITSADGASGSTGGTYYQNGDKPTITFTAADKDGHAVKLHTLQGISTTISGPNNNRQLVFPMKDYRTNTYALCDFAGRLIAPSTSNKGSMSRVIGSTASEVIKVQFTSTTTFAVTGAPVGLVAGPSLGAAGSLQAATSTNPASSSITELELGSNAQAETITVAFTDPTNFTVTGSISGAMGTGVMPATASASTRFASTDGRLNFTITSGATAFSAGNTFYMTVYAASNGHTFAILVGRTAFAIGDRFYYETVDNSLSSYTYNLPMEFTREYLGTTATGVAGETFTAANLPVYFGRETVYDFILQATTPGNTTASAANVVQDRYVTVNSITNFANNEYVVIERNTARQEFLQIGTIVGSQLWFNTPLRYAHDVNAPVEEVKINATLYEETNYTVDPAAGTITTVTPIAAGHMIAMSYRTDGSFGWKRGPGDSLQTYYPVPINDTPGMGQEWGKWNGLAYQNGTYDIALWASLPLYLPMHGETQTYRVTSRVAKADVLYGAAGTVAPYNLISSEANCDRCHDNLSFHGAGRRGHDSCTNCHGIVGFEDTPIYTNGGTSDSTPGMTWNFRTALHKIHMGAELANASSYAGGSFAEVEYPAMPGGAKACDTCHGSTSTVWKNVATRAHADQTTPTRNFGVVCGSCHDSTATTTHIDAMTTSAGAESCVTCHGAGQAYSVETVHKNR
jgi:OmcA/MtrC family decaheme c-type cytochrome